MTVKAQSRNGGFTLVEVIVALAIFALLVSMLYGSLTTVTRAYDAAEESVEEGARVRIGREFLSRLIENAYPLALADGRGWVAQFDGDAQSLRFIADMPGHVGASGMHEVRLRVREEDDTSALWFEWRPMMMDEDGSEVIGEYDERILIPDLKSMTVRYFGAPEEESDPQWSEEWIENVAMPSLVEVTLIDADDDPWPVMRLRPHANTLRYLSVRRGGGGSGDDDDEAAQLPPSDDPSGGLSDAESDLEDLEQRGPSGNLLEGAAGENQ